MQSSLLTALVAAAVALAAVVVGLLLRRRRRRHRTAARGDVERGFDLPGDAGAEGSPGGAPAAEPVRFTVYHPQELVPERWSKLAAYVHLAGARSEVEKDRDSVLAGEPPVHRERSSPARVAIAREASIRVVPELPGCRFNPPTASVLWLEDWHRVVFRVQAHAGAAGFAPGQAVNGRVAFFVESVLVGEVPIWALISDRSEPLPLALEPSAAAEPYDKIFVSYSHRDEEVVETLGRAYRALGMTFLRDVETLRSGERWNPRLLDLIEAADIFQLYWSSQAARSAYVTQEWRHALAQGRSQFIRPLYWQQPMEPPPDELSAVHFAFLPGFGRS